MQKFITGLKLHLKNCYGWRTRRRLVVFAVDDYGNVRVDSREARNNMDRAGLKILNRFDAYDSLENREDLEMLFEVLGSVRDMHGNHAVFSPFAVPCNMDFERMARDDFRNYYPELLFSTYQKMADRYPGDYRGAWELWQEGIAGGVMVPQFHGREHLHVGLLEEMLSRKDREVLVALQNRSYAGISSSVRPGIGVTAAFDFWKLDENARFESIIEDGINAFEEVFGYRPVHFNSPGGRENRLIHRFLQKNGIKYLDAPLIKKEHLGAGKYRWEFNYTGKRNELGMIVNVRNVVFEPGEKGRADWVAFAMKQIEAAFRWHRPAVISSHRVNFCGHISKPNRRHGIGALKQLLAAILKRWPDVEFLSSAGMMDLVEESLPVYKSE